MRAAISIGRLAAALAACADDDLIDGRFSAAEWDKIARFSPLAPPAPSPTNRHADDPAAAALGQRLWHETRFAGPLLVDGTPENGGLGRLGDRGKVACASCHEPQHWFSDRRTIPNALSLGTALTRRNTPSIVNAAFYTFANWGGAHDQLWKQGAVAAESRELFNSDRLTTAHVLYDHYRADYDAVFAVPLDPALDPAAPDATRFPASGMPKSAPAEPDGEWERMRPADQLAVDTIMANLGKAFEAYERLLVSRDAPFDRYVAGDRTALTAAEKRGLALFIGKAACDACHRDHTFTDNEFHVTGVEQTAEPLDDGRYADFLRLASPWNGAGMFSDDPVAGAAKLAGMVHGEAMRGQFRTKSLRHVAETAPYFHDGSMATLEDVVRFYNRGGGATRFPGEQDPRLVPLALTEAEIADLVAFLGSLTGAPIPDALLANTSR